MAGGNLAEAVARIYERGTTISELCLLTGLEAEEVQSLVFQGGARLRVIKVKRKPRRTAELIAGDVYVAPPPSRTWCTQCERLVEHKEAAVCASQWCKARVEA